MVTGIDWQGLAESLRPEEQSLWLDGEGSTTSEARRALELLIGEQQLRDTVDYYVERKRGSELARMVLSVVQPWSAMQRCYQIYENDPSSERRHAAVELLRNVADRRVLDWIPVFLRDEDPSIQNWGVGVLDQLLFSERAWPEQCRHLLEEAERHANEHVREMVTTIRKYLADRDVRQ